jgi:hypothetical protein
MCKHCSGHLLCACPDNQSVAHCRCSPPYSAYCDACGHNASTGVVAPDGNAGAAPDGTDG